MSSKYSQTSRFLFSWFPANNSSLAATVYPVLKSYQAFERYLRSAAAVTAANVNIGGFNVPLQALLKRAAGDQSTPIGHEEVLLQLEVLALQKWFVYWIVYGLVEILECVLLLKYVMPFYGLLRLLLLLWLMFPAAMGLLKTDPTVAQVADIPKDWDRFSQNGCGLVYYQLLKPWFDDDVSLWFNYDSSQMASFLAKFGLSVPYVGRTASAEPAEGQNFVLSAIQAMVASTGYFQTEAQPAVDPTSTTSATESQDDDYDVIDKPSVPEGLSQRNTGEQRKRGWLW